MILPDLYYLCAAGRPGRKCGANGRTFVTKAAARQLIVQARPGQLRAAIADLERAESFEGRVCGRDVPPRVLLQLLADARCELAAREYEEIMRRRELIDRHRKRSRREAARRPRCQEATARSAPTVDVDTFLDELAVDRGDLPPVLIEPALVEPEVIECGRPADLSWAVGS